MDLKRNIRNDGDQAKKPEPVGVVLWRMLAGGKLPAVKEALKRGTREVA